VLPTLSELIELAFPATCPGCGATGPATPLCPGCHRALAGARAGAVRPLPAPAGLPSCAALGPYRGLLRELLLEYKERGRLGLAGPLGAGLAAAVSVLAPVGAAVVLVPVPATAAAARARHGDHIRRLARRAARALRRAGRPAVVRPAVAALPRLADSAELSAVARAQRAVSAFRARPGPVRRLSRAAGQPPETPATRQAPSVPPFVVVVDDIVTTGSTLAAVSTVLADRGVPVWGAAVLAATQRRRARAAPAASPVVRGAASAALPLQAHGRGQFRPVVPGDNRVSRG
jgi:predicted amidophosphoribosyltransferase